MGFLGEVNLEPLAAARAARGNGDEAPGGAPTGSLEAPEEFAILLSQALMSAPL